MLRRFLDHPPQTNEVGRSAIFLGGFLEIAARSGLPLSLHEIGASAGLNLCWDRFAFHLGPHRWAGSDPGLTLTAEWRGPAPRLDVQPVIAGRQACDRRPVDLADPEARLRLQGYVWPEHLDRLASLRAAIALASKMGVQVDAADALDWTARKLATRPGGQAMVIYHSVVLQYFDAASRRDFAGMIEAAGARGDDRAPAGLALLRGRRAPSATSSSPSPIGPAESAAASPPPRPMDGGSSGSARGYPTGGIISSPSAPSIPAPPASSIPLAPRKGGEGRG